MFSDGRMRQYYLCGGRSWTYHSLRIIKASGKPAFIWVAFFFLSIYLLNIWTKTEHKTHQDCNKPFKAANPDRHSHLHGGLWASGTAYSFSYASQRAEMDTTRPTPSCLGFSLAVNWLYLLETGKVRYAILGGRNYERHLHIWQTEKGVFTSSRCPARLALAQTDTPTCPGHTVG